MKKGNITTKVICGSILLIFGILWILNTAIFHFRFSFEGWWTLFIIIPSLCGVITARQKATPAFFLGVGVIMLLCSQNVLWWDDVWKYILALVAITWGISLILNKADDGFQNDKTVDEDIKNINRDKCHLRQYNITFCERTEDLFGQYFEGADISVSFAGATLDLRRAEILDGAVISVNCIFGSLTLLVGEDIIVKNAIKTTLGGVNNARRTDITPGAKTIYLEGACSFAGVEVK